MSGISSRPVTEQAHLSCDASGCDRRYATPTYVVAAQWDQRERELAPAFALGWRVFTGARSLRTYCPQHGPKVQMRLAYPRGGAR